MSSNCLNCGHALSENFCSCCGQKVDVRRLNWKSLIDEILHFLTHIEKGFFRTTWLLATKPGMVIHEYLDGKRKKYHKPIGFLLIWITTFTLLFHFADHLFPIKENVNGTIFSDAANYIISRYRNVVELFILPFSALNAWLIIARPKLNYVELLAAFFYFTSFLFIVLTLQLIIALIFWVNFHSAGFDLVTICVYSLWLIYAGFSFYKQYKIRYLVVRMIISLVTGVIIYFGIAHLLGKLILLLNW